MPGALTLPALTAPDKVRERLAAGCQFNRYEMIRGGFIIAVGPATDCTVLAETQDARVAAYLVDALRAAHPASGGEADPCSGEHCCCCGPSEVCCDCGATMVDLPREVAEERWRDFLDANPDDLTGPEDLPNHALITFDQFYDMARDLMPRVALSPARPG